MARLRAIRRDLGDPPYRWLAGAFGQLGHVEEVSEALEKAIAIGTNFESRTRGRPAWFRLEDHAHMLDGLRKAGREG